MNSIEMYATWHVINAASADWSADWGVQHVANMACYK